jgi:hypothetical protein
MASILSIGLAAGSSLRGLRVMKILPMAAFAPAPTLETPTSRLP